MTGTGNGNVQNINDTLNNPVYMNKFWHILLGTY